MVTIIAIVEVKEGKMEEAKEILKEMALQVKESEPGTLEYIPYNLSFFSFITNRLV